MAGSSLRCALTACATSLLTFVTRTGLGAIPGLTPSGPNEARNPAVQRGPDLILATTLCCQTSLPGAAHENRSKRREFIILIGGAAARPLAASAQQGERVRKVGLLMGMESDPEARSRVKAFRPPEELGWSEDRNTKIEAVWGAGDADHVRADAADLIRAAPDVIVTNGAVRTTEVAKATAVIPVVFVQLPDPVDPRHRSRPCTSGAQCYRLHPLWLGALRPLELSPAREVGARLSFPRRARFKLSPHRGSVDCDSNQAQTGELLMIEWKTVDTH